MTLSSDQWLRIGMLCGMLLPCAAVILWAYTAGPAPEPTPEPTPEPEPEPEPVELLTDEHETEFMTVPIEHEAMAQIRQAIAGQTVKCAVCHGAVPDLYRVTFADGSAFCCHICAQLLRTGSPT